MTDLTPVLSSVITLIAAIITTFVIPYIKTKISVEKMKNLENWVEIAVKAAEMMYNGVGRGKEKKQYVLDYLKSLGLKFDETTLNNLIESKVLELKQSLSSN